MAGSTSPVRKRNTATNVNKSPIAQKPVAADSDASAKELKSAKNWGRAWGNKSIRICSCRKHTNLYSTWFFFELLPHSEIGWMTVLGVYFMLAFAPSLVFYFWSSCTSFECTLLGPAEYIYKNGFAAFYENHLPNYDDVVGKDVCICSAPYMHTQLISWEKQTLACLI